LQELCQHACKSFAQTILAFACKYHANGVGTVLALANTMPMLLAQFLQRAKAFCFGMALALASIMPTSMQNFCPMPWAKK
jgi:hypothetical protein